MNLRQQANGQTCVVCGSSNGTVVLHHIRVGGNGGMGLKPPDHHGIEVCARCHDWAHSPLTTVSDWKILLAAYQRQVERWIERKAIP